MTKYITISLFITNLFETIGSLKTYTDIPTHSMLATFHPSSVLTLRNVICSPFVIC